MGLRGPLGPLEDHGGQPSPGLVAVEPCLHQGLATAFALDEATSQLVISFLDMEIDERDGQ